MRLLTSQELVHRAQSGEDAARSELAERFRPLLRRFAQARLPSYARSRFDTEDLVQEAFLKAFRHLDTFDPQRRGAFLAFLRQIVMNLVRDELRSASNRRAPVEVAELLPDRRRGPSEVLFRKEALDEYERALATLRPEEQEAVILRLEMDCDYDAIARAIGKRSANSARMLVVRAVGRLAVAMSRFRRAPC